MYTADICRDCVLWDRAQVQFFGELSLHNKLKLYQLHLHWPEQNETNNRWPLWNFNCRWAKPKLSYYSNTKQPHYPLHLTNCDYFSVIHGDFLFSFWFKYLWHYLNLKAFGWVGPEHSQPRNQEVKLGARKLCARWAVLPGLNWRHLCVHHFFLKSLLETHLYVIAL